MTTAQAFIEKLRDLISDSETKKKWYLDVGEPLVIFSRKYFKYKKVLAHGFSTEIINYIYICPIENNNNNNNNDEWNWSMNMEQKYC